MLISSMLLKLEINNNFIDQWNHSYLYYTMLRSVTNVLQLVLQYGHVFVVNGSSIIVIRRIRHG